ncbi:Asp-tRNA(Asn)/Glu-tRNA(Gln) amidotransferase subunit GatA [Cellvibrio japonicus]|uniref:Glutamyl-tRNA(Gln) amidotransferase subunit A n=1 Tax=Cellvibrio japonicus (strain Ueda107) TaxID=498211 RepID=GATA_CELJU|nr:Asp-tRNA(Asn)/Glu-tRNA(Gln) amidotransferase subunit GatA [Cellvibrio japonicus]B3PC08.1 RecName: Full=Glutamyl-tRNA(Gln) amidotransferase subunit A; Short=Glu-ADT subunit A [Cellvibrio japonicus Ueda107]ACE83581.1 glutamyl-tRNA(Gln) amidotransferase subunit A [Cellvibrio japonicus Ueda107]QEI13163.1 Asp-tRNA(Asn)/Glu-tRNA(Gln) amidotransferase subunit GatA [Cellvibrio japonicus]QEI16737.1 Asp-tRNA(Asn)/Glu-tRNA(Gln) amidotransferase subunit GatA [Cellvibrio japonicus]QEI20315.1 Asp-tRNA(As
MHQFTIAELVKGLRNKDFSSTEITQHYLDRIARLDNTYNSYITVTGDVALQQAAAADKRLAAGNTSALCGVPIAHKDIFCTAGVRTSCASKMLDKFIAPYNATIVENYLKAGVVMLGKTNMDEFAMGSSNETSWYGPVKNPWNTHCVPGGSSGGSAAAVAAHLAPAATASDTGGSIRQPAALCGLTGIKPTYGRVSRWGMIAFASSLDQAGILSRTAEDAALLLNDMASYDPKDSTCIERDVPDYTADLNKPLNGLRIGVPKEYFGEGLNPKTAALVEAAIKVYESLGASIHSVSLPHTHLAVPAYYVIAPAECSANLSRFDGVRYGHRCEDPKDLMDLYMRSRSEGFGAEVKRRILVGTYALSAGYYDAYYSKAQKVRRLIKQDFVDAFHHVDVILGPTSPSPAFEFGSKGKDPVAMYLEDIYTIATNLAGLPGLSIPCGLVDDKPVGLQLIGNFFAEAQLLNAAHQFQQATDFHQQTAPGIE